MAINRIAYFAQTGVVSTPSHNYTFPINSANIEVSRPIESVTAFGSFNSLNQAQTNITTCKCSMKGHLGSGTNISGFNVHAISDIISTTQTGCLYISVGPQGFGMSGICTNIGLDIAVGGFGTFDIGFAGVGNPTLSSGTPGATDILNTGVGTNAWSICPVTTMSIGTTGLLSGVSATSVKFSYDLPTDTLTSLGENPNANQSGMNSIIATKAPYKATMHVEGFGVNATLQDAAALGGIQVGDIVIQLPNAKVTSRSFSNAAGQASATFSYSMEDVYASFTTGTVAAYVQDNNKTTTSTWGAS